MKLLSFVKNKDFILLCFIILIASILRLAFLGKIPYGFANDEVSYILSGYTISQTGGFDIAGKFLPLSINLDSSLSPVPVYLIASAITFFGSSAFIARLPFALLGIGCVILVYFIANQLFRNRGIAFWSTFVMALSPWHILITRGAWDAVPAQFFYLLGFYLFIKNLKKGSILWSLPFYLLGFFSYHGTKVFFLLFVLLTVTVFFKDLKTKKTQFVLFLIGILSIFALFAVITKTQTVTRQNEIIFTNKSHIQDVEKKVDFDRSRSSAPETLRKIESNKITFFADQMATNYFYALSPTFLITTGDIQQVYGYGVFFKGMIYPIDLLFLIIGLIIITLSFSNSKKKASGNHDQELFRKGSILVVCLLLVAPIPSVVATGSSYVIRSSMMIPFLSILIGIGINGTFDYFKSKKKFGIFLRIVILFVYLLFFARFLYQYYYQFNYYGGEFWNRSNRILSEYIIEKISDYDNIVISTSEDKLFLQYALFSKAEPSTVQKAWNKNWPVKFDKVSFDNHCLTKFEQENLSKKTLFIAREECPSNLHSVGLITDTMETLRVIWKIYDK